MLPEWSGTRIDLAAGIFPILVKFIFAQEKLSVQVHPDDAYASQHEKNKGGRGKTEMWYAIDAAPGAEVLVGLKPDVTAQQFKQSIHGESVEDFFQHIPLHPGEVMFVPAGTAHTIGAGLTLCEIQQNSDLTYRVYDYGRRDASGKPRELHLDKAFEVTRFGPQLGGKISPATRRQSRHQKNFLRRLPLFRDRTLAIRRPHRFPVFARTLRTLDHPRRLRLDPLVRRIRRLRSRASLADPRRPRPLRIFSDIEHHNFAHLRPLRSRRRRRRLDQPGRHQIRRRASGVPMTRAKTTKRSPPAPFY